MADLARKIVDEGGEESPRPERRVPARKRKQLEKQTLAASVEKAVSPQPEPKDRETVAHISEAIKATPVAPAHIDEVEIVKQATAAINFTRSNVAEVIADISRGQSGDMSEEDRLDAMLAHIEPLKYTIQVTTLKNERMRVEGGPDVEIRTDGRRLQRVDVTVRRHNWTTRSEIVDGKRVKTQNLTHVVTTRKDSRLRFSDAAQRVRRDLHRAVTSPECLANVTWLAHTQLENPKAWEEARALREKGRRMSEASRKKYGQPKHSHRYSHNLMPVVPPEARVPRMDALVGSFENEFFVLDHNLNEDGSISIRAVDHSAVPEQVKGYSADPVKAAVEAAYEKYHTAMEEAWCSKEQAIVGLGQPGNSKKRRRKWHEAEDRILAAYHDTCTALEEVLISDIDASVASPDDEVLDFDTPSVGEECMYADDVSSVASETTAQRASEGGKTDPPEPDGIEDMSPAAVRSWVRIRQARHVNMSARRSMAYLSHAEDRALNPVKDSGFPLFPHETEHREVPNRGEVSNEYARIRSISHTEGYSRAKKEWTEGDPSVAETQPEEPKASLDEGSDSSSVPDVVEYDLSTVDGRLAFATVIGQMTKQRDRLAATLIAAKVKYEGLGEDDEDEYVNWQPQPDDVVERMTAEGDNWDEEDHLRMMFEKSPGYADHYVEYCQADYEDNLLMGWLADPTLRGVAISKGFSTSAFYVNSFRPRTPDIVVERVVEPTQTIESEGEDIAVVPTSYERPDPARTYNNYVFGNVNEDYFLTEGVRSKAVSAMRRLKCKRMAVLIWQERLRREASRLEQLKYGVSWPRLRQFGSDVVNRLVGDPTAQQRLDELIRFREEDPEGFAQWCVENSEYRPATDDRDDSVLLDNVLNPELPLVRRLEASAGHSGRFKDMTRILYWRYGVRAHDDALAPSSYNHVAFPTRAQQMFPELYDPITGKRKHIKREPLMNKPDDPEALQAELIHRTEAYKADLDREDAEKEEEEQDSTPSPIIVDPSDGVLPVGELTKIVADANERIGGGLPPGTLHLESKRLFSRLTGVIDLAELWNEKK